jgi:hypothetical protein
MFTVSVVALPVSVIVSVPPMSPLALVVAFAPRFTVRVPALPVTFSWCHWWSSNSY